MLFNILLLPLFVDIYENAWTDAKEQQHLSHGMSQTSTNMEKEIADFEYDILSHFGGLCLY